MPSTIAAQPSSIPQGVNDHGDIMEDSSSMTYGTKNQDLAGIYQVVITCPHHHLMTEAHLREK